MKICTFFTKKKHYMLMLSIATQHGYNSQPNTRKSYKLQEPIGSKMITSEQPRLIDRTVRFTSKIEYQQYRIPKFYTADIRYSISQLHSFTLTAYGIWSHRSARKIDSLVFQVGMCVAANLSFISWRKARQGLSSTCTTLLLFLLKEFRKRIFFLTF